MIRKCVFAAAFTVARIDAVQLEEYSRALCQAESDSPVPERTHDELQKELLDLSKQLLSEWDDYDIVVDKPDRNYVAKIKNDEDGPVTLLAHIKADGFSFEKFKVYYDDPTSMDAIYDGRIHSKKLGGETTESSSA